MVIDICVAIITLAFICLAIFFICVLYSAGQALKKINLMLDEFQPHLDPLRRETQILLHNTNEITRDLQDKMEALNSLVQAASNVGNILKESSASLKPEPPQPCHRTAEAFVELAVLGLSLWQKLKKGR